MQETCHSKTLDLEAIKIAKNINGINLYCISQNTALSEFLPLAPIQQKENISINNVNLEKKENYINDLIKLPKARTLKQKFVYYGLTYDNIFLKLFLDIKQLFKILVTLIRN